MRLTQNQLQAVNRILDNFFRISSVDIAKPINDFSSFLKLIVYFEKVTTLFFIQSRKSIKQHGDKIKPVHKTWARNRFDFDIHKSKLDNKWKSCKWPFISMLFDEETKIMSEIRTNITKASFIENSMKENTILEDFPGPNMAKMFPDVAGIQIRHWAKIQTSAVQNWPKNLQNLTIMNLRSKTFPRLTIPNLTQLKLKYFRKLEDLTNIQNLPNLEYLLIQDNYDKSLKSISAEVFKTSRSLKQLIISQCRGLKSLDSQLFFGLDNLEHFTLESTSIIDYGEGLFRNNLALKDVRISYRYILKITRSLVKTVLSKYQTQLLFNRHQTVLGITFSRSSMDIPRVC